MTRWITIAPRQHGFCAFSRNGWFEPCVYALYRSTRLIYIGSTKNLFYRLRGHKQHPGVSFLDPTVIVKFSFDRVIREHMVRERRLIEKLGPSLNKTHKRAA